MIISRKRASSATRLVRLPAYIYKTQFMLLVPRPLHLFPLSCCFIINLLGKRCSIKAEEKCINGAKECVEFRVVSCSL